MVTQERLKEVLDYDSETGIFTRYKMHLNGDRRTVGEVAGWANPSGYIKISIDNKSYSAHRLAWLFVYGFMPQMIDHKNNISGDNRMSNLRESNKSTNAMNQKKTNGCSSKFKGVTFMKRDKNWQARIGLNGKRIYLGSFDTEEEAHKAYCSGGKILFGEFFRSA